MVAAMYEEAIYMLTMLHKLDIGNVSNIIIFASSNLGALKHSP